ncbi:MAG TPA: TylF/MycF/NovP-related O-methyltransferase [Chloroflexota bacterium]
MESIPGQRFTMLDPRTQTSHDREYSQRLDDYYARSLGTNVDKLRNFAKYVPRQTLSLFLAKHEIFQRVLRVHGAIVECGVFLGGGLMTWAQLSAIYEPINHGRRVVGFDTFAGFPGLDGQDQGDSPAYATAGGLATDACADVRESVELFDLNRPLGHVPRVELVVGDALETIPRYLEENQHLVVAMLYLDFDLYAPTKLAIETFRPRMPRGAVLAFDELGQAAWPGETLAALETVGLRDLRLERSPITPALSYAVLE